MRLVKGKYGPTSLCLWRDVARPLIAKRDGEQTAASYGQGDKGSFWVDRARLIDSEDVCVAAMAFIGHTGKSAGSYASFHSGMAKRARQVSALGDMCKEKDGMRRELMHIGTTAMQEASDLHLGMLELTPERAARPAPTTAQDTL